MLRDLNLKQSESQSLSSIYISILSILLCMVCLVGSSWAWFTANYEYGVADIQSAEYAIKEIEVFAASPASPANLEGDAAPVAVELTEGSASFYAEANTLYTVTANANGTASAGFLEILTPDGSFYYSGSGKVSFSLLLAQAGNVNISASWGQGPEESLSFDLNGSFGNGDAAAETASEETSAPESSAEAEADPATEESTEPPTVSEAETVSETEPGVEPEPEISNESEPDVEPEPEPETSNEAEPDVEPEPAE